MMPPQRYASARYKSRPAAFIPFRDDTNLVALRYDQTTQAEPPIPIPPAKSPLRYKRAAATRPTSCVSTPGPAPVVVTPPYPPPSGPLPLPPTEEHPAFRTLSTARTYIDDPKRDSGHATTLSSQAHTFYEESSEDDDPFPYEKIGSFRRPKFVPELLVPPLRIRSSSPTSLYSDYQSRGYSVDGTNNHSRTSIPLSSPGLSEANTVSPTSPTTPPPNFPDKTSSSSIFSRRSFSFRSAGPSMKSTKRLKKKHQPQAVVEDHEETPALSPKGAKTAASSPLVNVAPPPRNGDGHDGARSPNSPKLSGASAPDGDDFADFVHQISFSKRGSIMLGGKRPSRHAATMSNDSGFAQREPAQEQRPPRAFPLAPSVIPKPSLDGAAPSIIVEGDEPRRSVASERATTPPAGAPSSPNSPQHPPSIRLIPIDVERESQKVRSLYEPGEGLRWEDGGRVSSYGERLEPTVEVPSDVDENASRRSLSPSRSINPADQPGAPTPATGIPESAAPSALRPDEPLRNAYELAGGIEDWEDVQVEDVDRYGFIAPRRPMTPSSAPPTVMDSPKQYSPRKRRNVLARKDAAQHSQYLGTRRGPSRKLSARSLHTQASGFSTTSRRSTRSALRQAANLLPHNKDRRWMDEAGEMLAQQHGFISIGDDAGAGQLADEYKQKESSRTEKWRKMAKVIKPGKDGEGMFFEFDTKNPKLIERTWKGIPDRWRAAAWYSFLSTSARDSKKPLATEEELVAKFHSLQEQPSPDDVQIDLDVPRTISQHIMFRRRYRGGQRLLFRVLHALSLYFPVTGYVQGMASLAATLLSYYDEEKCFIMLVRLWELRGLKRLYSPNFVELMEALQDFEKYWLAEKGVAKSLKELCIDPTAYGTRWYLTLFHLSIPFSSFLRIWDVFMLLGESPPDPPSSTAETGKQVSQHASSKGLEILHATSTSIVLALSEHIIDSEFENAMKALTSFVPIKNDDLLMKVVRAEYKQHLGKTKKT
ncbi:hypothetical protein AB5N19_00919 [Seiridium cardinale]|uniref:Rab-GAP TBC domain-containing protein n=1 Tax=Seiridium cardinale TaxID=138064 RepID=A0ABR2X6J2_9PEZI